MDKIQLDYNSTYISLNLIDELDYVIGQYGKPNITFIYTLNAFIESFVLNSIFYISSQEYNHLRILSKSLFPNGRPILELLINTKSLKCISGIGNNIGQVVGIFNNDMNNPRSYQEKIKEFMANGLDTNTARSKYLTLSDIDVEVKKIKFLALGKVEGGFVALESTNKPENFYNDLYKATYFSNVQAVLPFYSYKQQISQNKARCISRDIINELTIGFEKRQEIVKQYFGCYNQPIPPLVNILLSQCNTINDITQKILQLRLDFSELRESVVKYEKRIKDSKTIKEQIDAIKEYNEFWVVFNNKYINNSNRLVFNFWEILDNSNLEKSIYCNTISDIIEDLNIGKIIGKSSSKIINYYKENKIINRFRGVTNLWNLLNNSPNIEEQINNYERIFKVKLDTESFDKLRDIFINIKHY
jgi:hypothetical protein